MARADRLLALLQVLRRFRRPVSAERLSRELGVSTRTIYRDIASLQAGGANIAGEPGVGYVLRPGFTIPPLMFSPDEIEAILLGAQWVKANTDPSLASAASDVVAKINEVLPQERKDHLQSVTLAVAPSTGRADEVIDAALLRQAIRQERKLAIIYGSGEKTVRTERVIWPFALGYFERTRVVVAWCELRNDFRHFRTDKILGLRPLEVRYPRRRASLFKAWRKTQPDASWIRSDLIGGPHG